MWGKRDGKRDNKKRRNKRKVRIRDRRRLPVLYFYELSVKVPTA
jgi:hypothetical protein